MQNARVAFVDRARIGFKITPGQPIFPVAATARWEYWVYTEVDGGMEITFVKEFEDKGYDLAPFPHGLPLRVTVELHKLEPGPVLRDAAIRHPSVYEPGFADLPIDFYYYTAGFRGTEGKSRLEIYYGLPASEIGRLDVGEGTDLVVLDRGVALFDSLWNEVHRSSDQIAFELPTEKQVQAGAFIPGELPVELDPGPYWMALQVRDVVSGRSQVYKQEVLLGDYGDDGPLAISDIELAFSILPQEEGEDFVKQGLRVIPMSSRAFRRDQNAFVYFEIYNLSRDEFGQTHYRVEYGIRSGKRRSLPARILKGLGSVLRASEKDRQVSVAYDQIGSAREEVAYVELDLSESGEGDQRVRVKVTDGVSNQDAEKEITFSIVPWK